MDNATRHARIARRFLISLVQQYGPAAPSVLRQWAIELEQMEADMKSEDAQQDRPQWTERGGILRGIVWRLNQSPAM